MRPPAHQLEYFVAVAEEKQFTRAAERLHIAQPSVSAQIRQLERFLGTPLFHRGPGPVTLTDAGQAILPLARRVLSELGEVVDVIDDLDALRRGHVAIGATPSLSATLLPSVLGRFRRRHPGVRLTMTEQGSLHLVDELESGVLDVALAILPLNRPTLESVSLATEELVVVTSHDHELAHRRSVGIADLRDVPMVMFRDGYDLRTSTLVAFSQLGLDPHIAVEGGEMAGVLALVAEGVGAAVVPSIVAIDPRLHVLRIRTPRLTRTIGLVRRQDREPSRAAAALFAEITKSLEDSGWPGHVPTGLRLLARQQLCPSR
ncbi:MAG: LysR family transcriptional regulator [Acidimicrobiales bacterium]